MLHWFSTCPLCSILCCFGCLSGPCTGNCCFALGTVYLYMDLNSIGLACHWSRHWCSLWCFHCFHLPYWTLKWWFGFIIDFLTAFPTLIEFHLCFVGPCGELSHPASVPCLYLPEFEKCLFCSFPLQMFWKGWMCRNRCLLLLSVFCRGLVFRETVHLQRGGCRRIVAVRYS